LSFFPIRACALALQKTMQENSAAKVCQVTVKGADGAADRCSRSSK
jgi:hypothetical protein